MGSSSMGYGFAAGARAPCEPPDADREEGKHENDEDIRASTR